MTPMEFTSTVRGALQFVCDMHKDAGLKAPQHVYDALAMLDPEPDAAAPPLLRIGPGGDFVKDWPPERTTT